MKTTDTGRPIGAIKLTNRSLLPADSVADFEKRLYFNIDQIYTGKVYANKLGKDVFYRILIVPEEENILLLAENIEVGDEGGNSKLVKLLRLTDDNSVFPKFDMASIDSLKFIDSVNIQGYFNHRKKIINLEQIKPYHVSY